MTKDWNFHKKKIIKLYKTEGMTLEQVREYMIREWNFKAGIRTYRIYLQKWNVRKYKKRFYHAAPYSAGVYQLSEQAPSLKQAEAILGSDTYPRIHPASRTIPWLDIQDVSHPAAWPTRSPSTVPSESIGSSVHNGNGHFIESALPASPSVASEYVGSPAHDGHFLKPAMPVRALSDEGYSGAGEPATVEMREEFGYYPLAGMWAYQKC